MKTLGKHRAVHGEEYTYSVRHRKRTGLDWYDFDEDDSDEDDSQEAASDEADIDGANPDEAQTW